MALLGIQFVISLVVALFLQKLSPFYSLARWIMAKGLYRYLHPTNDQLKALTGKPTNGNQSKGKKRKNVDGRNSNGRINGADQSGPETFTVPCNLHIDMELVQVEEMDIYSQYKYQDYKWLVDYSFCALLVYLLIEVAGYLRPQVFSDEFSIGFVWCGMVVFFAIKDLLSLTAAYWRSADSGERSMTISFGFFFLVVAMGVLVIDEDILDFGLNEGYANFTSNLLNVYKKLDFQVESTPSIWSFKILLAIFAAFIGAISGFPGIRYANVHLDSLTYAAETPHWQAVYHFSFLCPLMLSLLWISPLSKDLVVPSSRSDPKGKIQISAAMFDAIRIHAVPFFCIIRLLLSRRFLQSYLNSAYQKVEKMKKERGRITNLELQRKVARVFYYLSAAALQYIAPMLLLLFAGLMYRTLTYNMTASGELSVTYDVIANMTSNREETKEYAKLIRSLFTVELVRGIFSFITWWCLVAFFVTSCFGVVYLKYLS